MCAFYLTDVSRGREPNRRLAFGGCLQTLALCSVSILVDTLCRLLVNLRNRGPRGILCTRGEKAHTNKRVSIIACNNVISKVQCATHRPERTPHYKTHARYFRTCVEKKAHTSIRVSIVAPDNAISKVQCAPRKSLSIDADR